MPAPPDPNLEYAKPITPSRYIGAAIFALVLSILGVAIFPLPVFAFWITRSILKNPDQIDAPTRSAAAAGRRIAFFTAPISALILLIFIGLPSLDANRPSGRIWCSSNMRQIGLALKMYAYANNDFYPPNLPTLLKAGEIAPEVFICPSSSDQVDRSTTHPSADSVIPGTSHCSYIYFADPAIRDSTVSPDRIMLIESLNDHDGEGMNVLYADDHVDWVEKKEADLVMAQLLIGQWVRVAETDEAVTIYYASHPVRHLRPEQLTMDRVV